MPINKEIESEMKAELKNYPASERGNPILLEKVYKMAVGSIQLKAPKPSTETPNPIIGRRIVSNNPNPAGSGAAPSAPSTPSAKLTDDERNIARKMGISEVDYAKHKGNVNITGPEAPK